jgi:hypothetical protein
MNITYRIFLAVFVTFHVAAVAAESVSSKSSLPRFEPKGVVFMDAGCSCYLLRNEAVFYWSELPASHAHDFQALAEIRQAGGKIREVAVIPTRPAGFGQRAEARECPCIHLLQR